MQITHMKPTPGFRKRRRKYDTTGFKYFSFLVNYNNCPDVYEYFFKAKTSKEVARATGTDLALISECSAEEISNAIRHRKHIDIVINGRLVEPDDD